jgi:phage shock protein E
MGLFGSLIGKKSNSSSELLEKIQAGAMVFDVRGPGEFKEGHYPKAVNIPVDKVQARIGEFGPKDKTVIVYCLSGARSAMAAKLLRAAGYVDVVNAGGLGDMPA